MTEISRCGILIPLYHNTNTNRTVDNIVEEYNTGDVDLHQMVADLAGITRKEAKVVNLGIMYGMGKGKLGDQLGIST